MEGRSIEAHLLGSGREAVLLIAAIHGDEPAGAPLLLAFVERARQDPSLLAGRRVIVIPVANPDGFASHRRDNANEVDLNRNFPSLNWTRKTKGYGVAALSEPETQVIDRLVRAYRPRSILSIHQPLRCVDYDGPARALAERVSAACGLPVRKLGARPGSLGAYAGMDRAIAIINLELPPDARHKSGDELWKRYGEAVRAVVRGPRGIGAGSPSPSAAR